MIALLQCSQVDLQDIDALQLLGNIAVNRIIHLATVTAVLMSIKDVSVDDFQSSQQSLLFVTAVIVVSSSSTSTSSISIGVVCCTIVSCSSISLLTVVAVVWIAIIQYYSFLIEVSNEQLLIIP